ncbi:MAG: hypothetical protein WD557_18235 [Dehalococcoidia bacterium]
MDDETRDLIGELLEAVAAILVSIEVDYAPRPSAGDQRHSLRRAQSLLKRARETLRATSAEPDPEARRIASAILRQYTDAGSPFGASRAGMAQWLALGVELGARQKGQRTARAR